MAVHDVSPHPVDLIDEASRLDAEAEEFAAYAREFRAEAAALRSQADRLLHPERGAQVKPKRKPKTDELLAAAGLAVEDLPAGFEARDLARQLGIVDERRAQRLLASLAEMGQVSRFGDGWASLDPDEIRVRDYIVEKGEFTFGDACIDLAMAEVTLSYYVERFVERKLLEKLGGGGYRYVPTGPERVITTHPKRRPPEKEPPAGTQILSPRGVQQRVESQANRRQALSQPGVRLRLKNKERARERMAAAKAEAAERAKARAARQNGQKKKRK